MFYDSFGRFGDKLAFLTESRAMTYNELKKRAEEIGNVIREKALVLQFCNNSIGSVSGYLSFLHNGIVPILVNTSIDTESYRYLIEVYQPEYVYIPNTMKEQFNDVPVVYEEYEYSILKVNEGKAYTINEALAVLLTTSGSTGSPKLVRQSYNNIQANAKSIAEYLSLDEKERPITLLPMNYTYGLSIINSHILVGATILLTDRSLMERELWEFFKEQEATSLGGVPYTYEILKKLRFLKMNLPSLKTMTQAGGKLSIELHKEFAEYAYTNNKKFIVMYGQTEATARMAYLPSDRAIDKCGSMGIAIPGGELTLIDSEGMIIEGEEQIGELVYRGPNVTLGYAEDRQDLAKGDERGGVLETGDMAKRDLEGYYYIVGRKKRFLKIYGNRVNLDEVERLIKGQFDYLECACVGVDDKLEVFVTTKDVREMDGIRNFLSQKTNIHPMAFRVRYVEKIPKNESGKTLYKKLDAQV